MFVCISGGCSASKDAETKALLQKVADLERAQQATAQQATAQQATAQQAAAQQAAAQQAAAQQAAAQQAAAQQAAAQQAAAQHAAANAARSREDVLKKGAHICADTVNKAHLGLARAQGEFNAKDFYNELYAEIYARLDAETVGLTGDAFTKKFGDIAQQWIMKKGMGY